MGANFATYVANLALGYHEFVFLRAVYSAAYQPHATNIRLNAGLAYDILIAFMDTYRFADDLASLDNPFLPLLLSHNQLFADALPGIYPLELKLAPSGHSSPTQPSVPYLNFAIEAHATITPGHVAYTVQPYDKRDSPKFRDLPIHRFTPFYSAIPAHSKLNIVVNSLVAVARHSSHARAFYYAARAALQRLTTRAYPRSFLQFALHTFYTRHAHLLADYPRRRTFLHHLLPPLPSPTPDRRASPAAATLAAPSSPPPPSPTPSQDSGSDMDLGTATDNGSDSGSDMDLGTATDNGSDSGSDMDLD